MYIHCMLSVYFKISLKRGQTPSANIQGGGIYKSKGGPILKVGKADSKAPPGLPEINPMLTCTHS